MIVLTELIRKAQAGDGEAFIRLMEENRQSLYKIARSWFPGAMDAEDAVAQTVLDCWEKLDTLKKPAHFRTWLIRILINNCKDIVRDRSRLVLTDMPPEPEGRPDDHSGLYFQELMDALSQANRPVMQLYYGEGFKAREIAALMDLPLGTVTARLKRGREELQRKLGKEENGIE